VEQAEVSALVALERSPMEPAVRGSQGRLAQVLDVDVVERCASGGGVDRAAVPAHLPGAVAVDQAAGRFDVRLLADGLAQLRFRTGDVRAGRARVCLLSPLWRRHGADWKIRFHQASVQPERAA